MRVVEITAEPIFHGGQEKFIYNLIENINNDSISIDVVTPYSVDNELFCSLVEQRGGIVYGLGKQFNPGKNRKQLFGLMSAFLKDKQYDVAHIHSGSISALAFLAKAAKENGIKKIIVHSHSTAESSIKHSLVRCFYSKVMQKYATEYLACSKEAGTDKYTKDVVEKKLVIIPNGIDVEKYKRNTEVRDSIREFFGIKRNSYVIGHVGRFSYQKNHDYIIDLFKEIHGRIDDSHLLLVGDGELYEDIYEKVRLLGLKKSVHFTGNVDNVEVYYNAMDLFVFPSRFEGFGYAALEAQAAGLPCLISTEVPDSVAIGENINMISLNDFNDWVDAAINYYGVAVVNNNQAILNSGYSVFKTASLIEKIYSN